MHKFVFAPSCARLSVCPTQAGILSYLWRRLRNHANDAIQYRPWTPVFLCQSLSYAVVCVILCLAILAQCRLVTD